MLVLIWCLKSCLRLLWFNRIHLSYHAALSVWYEVMNPPLSVVAPTLPCCLTWVWATWKLAFIAIHQFPLGKGDSLKVIWNDFSFFEWLFNGLLFSFFTYLNQLELKPQGRMLMNARYFLEISGKWFCLLIYSCDFWAVGQTWCLHQKQCLCYYWLIHSNKHNCLKWKLQKSNFYCAVTVLPWFARQIFWLVYH